MVGTDIPSLTTAALERALATLEEHEVVLGASVDGGFYLVGATRLAPGFLQARPRTGPGPHHSCPSPHVSTSNLSAK